ncbi:MAG: DNA-binding protein [Erythrobacteraceae bacterium]|nr:DNA-binding protein [Erythrobacteraceae bacterium]
MKSLLGKLRGLFFLQYNHEPTSVSDQILLLQSRGISGDEDLMRRWLRTVGYYRLSAYWLPLELPPSRDQTRSKRFPPGTAFSDIIDIYVFDRKLRLLVMEAVDRFEIAVRARWTNLLSLAHGSHAHVHAKNFHNGFEHARMFAKIAKTAEESSEVFVEHYRKKYTDPFVPSLWHVTELMTLGELSLWVKATSDNRIKDELARDLGLPNKEVLEGTLQLLSYIRNICAHHSRLWNRKTVKRAPNIRQMKSDMDIDRSGKQHQLRNSIYNVLVILARTLRYQSPDTTFPQRVRSLIETRSAPQQIAMGFPSDWRSRPIWRIYS